MSTRVVLSKSKAFVPIIIGSTIVLLANSSLGLAIHGLATLIIVVTLGKNRTISIALVALITAAGAIFFNQVFSQRAIFLFDRFLADGFSIIYSDASTYFRVTSIFHAIFESIRGFGLPNGFSTFDETYANSRLFWSTMALDLNDNRINSGVGTYLYQIGFFAIPYFYTIAKITGVRMKSWFSDLGIIHLILALNAWQLYLPFLWLHAAGMSRRSSLKSL